MILVKWIDSGTLARLYTSFERGVYIFVYNGTPKRIIYVGTAKKATGFSGRWCDHLKDFICLGRTIWRPKEGQDIYELMSLAPDKYKKLSEKGKVWIPGNERDKGIWSPLYKDHQGGTTEEWIQYVNEYLPKISVWRCAIDDNHVNKLMVQLESQIQRALINSCGISYHRECENNSWLGKIEVTDFGKVDFVDFKFECLPIVDTGTQEILKNLKTYLAL